MMHKRAQADRNEGHIVCRLDLWGGRLWGLGWPEAMVREKGKREKKEREESVGKRIVKIKN